MALIAQGANAWRSATASSTTAPVSTWSPRSTCRSPATTPRPPPTARARVRPVLRPAAIAELLLAPTRPPAGGPPAGLASPTRRPSSWTPSCAWSACWTTRDDQTVLAPLIEREILWRLITGPLGADVRQSAWPTAA